jgi:hypothetical protein
MLQNATSCAVSHCLLIVQSMWDLENTKQHWVCLFRHIGFSMPDVVALCIAPYMPI